jgi:hypothetical protein
MRNQCRLVKLNAVAFDLGNWTLGVRHSAALFTELEICDLIEEYSFVSDFNVQ